jgi:hypothetical protein
MAIFWSPNHKGPFIPMLSRRRLMPPISSLYIKRQIKPIAVGAAIMGKRAKERKILTG